MYFSASPNFMTLPLYVVKYSLHNLKHVVIIHVLDINYFFELLINVLKYRANNNTLQNTIVT